MNQWTLLAPEDAHRFDGDAQLAERERQEQQKLQGAFGRMKRDQQPAKGGLRDEV